MLVQSVRGAARGPVAQGARNTHEWTAGKQALLHAFDESGITAVFHTFGYPEPEIFGFFYVHPGAESRRPASSSRRASAPPMRTSYRYLQHFILHPYLWQHLKGGRLRSWGAKSLQKSGRRGEPFLCGDGYARIGEGSSSTNVLTGSSVDEAARTPPNRPERARDRFITGRHRPVRDGAHRPHRREAIN